MAVTGAAFVTLAILALTAASGVGFAQRAHGEDARRKGAQKAHAQARFDDEEADDEPGLAMVSIGAVIHTLLTAKAVLRRLMRRRPKSAAKAAAGAAREAAPSPPWFGLRAGDGGLTDPAAYAPRANSAVSAEPPAPRASARPPAR